MIILSFSRWRKNLIQVIEHQVNSGNQVHQAEYHMIIMKQHEKHVTWCKDERIEKLVQVVIISNFLHHFHDNHSFFCSNEFFFVARKKNTQIFQKKTGNIQHSMDIKSYT